MSQTSVHSPTSVANRIQFLFSFWGKETKNHTFTYKAIFSFCLLIITSFYLSAQDSTQINQIPPIQTGELAIDTSIVQIFIGRNNTYPPPLTKTQIKRRIRTVAIANVAGYSAVMVGLNAAWYANYPRSSFHTFNDDKEWLQVDKVGHMYSAYIESRASMELWRWTGIERKKRIWLGGLSGAVYQTVIETLDGFSAEWGWSWGDFSANVLGSGALIAQELAWDDQRIKLKFSFHKNSYADAQLNQRADNLFGNTLSERFIKDYNAQTYWASANLKPFFPKSNLPDWLGIAVGYGANGMFGGFDNTWEDKNTSTTINRSDVKRYRQWYLSPDIDFSKIKTRKKGVKFLFSVLSAFKFPAPSIEFSNGKFKLHAIHF